MPDWQVYDWRDEALCAYVDSPDVWFPGPGDSVKVARKVCALCPVRQECLMFAIRNGEYYGMWGGMIESERRAYAAAHDIPYRAERLAPLQAIDEDDETEETTEARPAA